MTVNLRIVRIFFLFAALVLAVSSLALSCTKSDDSDKRSPTPYDYTHTTELQQAEFYENPRIENAERSAVISLDQLGYPELVITSGDEAENPSVQYRLPADATQGPDTWYVVHLHCLIEFDESTGGGFGSVKISTNDFGGASVHFDTQTINNSPMISFGGMHCTSTRIEVHYYKYATLMGVKPGTNTMTFGFSAKNKAKINRVTYYGDTGIESTTVPPSDLAYRDVVSQEDRLRAEAIALGAAEVREIVDGVDYAVRTTWEDTGLAVVAEQFVEAEDADEREVEVRLMFEETQMVEDVEAAALSVYVNLEDEQVTGVFPLSSIGMPELTQSRKEAAMSIALNDPHVAAMLESSDYTLRQASICRGGPVGRIGALLIFDFHPYLEYDGDFPFFPGEDVRHLEGRIHDINVSINFQEEKVVQIYPTTIPQVRSDDAT